MRIISGIRKGHKLIEFEGQDIRPTTDRVKESLFNLIQEFIPDAEVLDLFGGSGALSLEAVSRGAKSAACVDIDQRSVDVIRKNTESLNFNNVSIIRDSAENFVTKTKQKFSVIFLDPPYNKGFIEPIIQLIVKHELLCHGGIIALESDFIDEHGEFDGLSIIKQKKYGRSYVTIYQRG